MLDTEYGKEYPWSIDPKTNGNWELKHLQTGKVYGEYSSYLKAYNQFLFYKKVEELNRDE